MLKGSFSRSEMLYLTLATLFSVVVIIANLITVKLISIPYFSSLALPCGLLVYPLTFFVGDLVTELFGVRRAKFMVYLGFAMGLFTHGIVHLAIKLPPHTDWVSLYNPYGYESSAAYQAAFHSIFGLNGIALLSSIAAYSIAQVLDIRLFSFLKEMTYGRFLWLRNCGSTMTSQLIDTLIVNTLLLYCGLKLDLETVVHISLICYTYKLLFTITNVPLFYLAVSLSKKFLGDEYEEYSPKLLSQLEPKMHSN